MSSRTDITVTRTDSGNPGVSGWSAILGDPPPARRLAADDIVDVAVIGGGFAGLAAARRLRQLRPYDRIALVDAIRIGDGAAGRSSGFMIDLPHDINSKNYAGAAEADRIQTGMNRSALAFAEEAAAEYGMGRQTLERRGKTNVAATASGEAHNRDYLNHLYRLGEEAVWLDAAQMQALTGTGYYRSGLDTPGTIMIQPAGYLRAMARGLERSIDVFEDSPVTAMHRRNGAWRIATPGGSLTAPTVIMAVNGHLESFGFFSGRLMHVYLYASMTRALTDDEAARMGGHDTWELVPADPMGSTLRRFVSDQGPRIVVRNVFRFATAPVASEASVGRAAPAHDRAFARRFPHLRDVEMEYRWGGRLCLSFNGVPVFGEIGEGMYAACVQNGLGASKGTLSGMLAAELACGLDSPAIRQHLAQPRPQRIPPKPLSWIGANVYLRWKEWRAGAEK